MRHRTFGICVLPATRFFRGRGCRFPLFPIFFRACLNFARKIKPNDFFREIEISFGGFSGLNESNDIIISQKNA
jgi:hypothetical protein